MCCIRAFGAGQAARQGIRAIQRDCRAALVHVSNSAHVLLQGGATIEQLRQSTRANIKVERETQGCLERLICISSAAAPAQPLCPAQDALFCVQDRLNGLDSSEACLTVSHLRFCQHPRIQQPQICRLEPDGCALPFLKQGLSL